jgi:hypothetical protein
MGVANWSGKMQQFAAGAVVAPTPKSHIASSSPRWRGYIGCSGNSGSAHHLGGADVLRHGESGADVDQIVIAGIEA